MLLWEVMSLGYMPYPGRGNQEVMQLVTSGGRLEAPPGCPGPAYRIMVHCWHTNPEERPTFVTVLERIGYCIQDPDVLAMPLPVSQRPLSAERDTTATVNTWIHFHLFFLFFFFCYDDEFDLTFCSDVTWWLDTYIHRKRHHSGKLIIYSYI